ncbi:hypothetical protein BCR32DRAFT_282872 [Anaeromyces robustus]|uniref:Lipoprotein n=1 Tax=Anaeromyces robustus TaxID=1754192 RepID=A0A1Y1WW68_9FUNG|nr:hypothetical protein BCR32DRAFT_282872 [Anaeromyces robustus]|eukprot:ORX77797.1 hypothetical protein BCR32DRAFT_282872 [Anaeromyces robustus]
MKSLSFVLVILILLSCVFSKNINLSSNDEEINSSWKTVITHLFDNENVLNNENGLQRRKKDECHCICQMVGIDLDKLTTEVDGAFSIIKLIYKVMLSPLAAVAAVMNYEIYLIDSL